MEKIRPSAVAGSFYPANDKVLRNLLTDLLSQAQKHTARPIPKAIIAPHAGYIYSGPIAASAYACLASQKNLIRRVILLGPAHHGSESSIATTSANSFETPLGKIPIDQNAIQEALTLSQVKIDNSPHAEEHSLEVQLPFLQATLGNFSIVPFVFGEAEPSSIAEVIELLWGTKETLIVISTDLSHYLDYETAQKKDELTSRSILAYQYQHLDSFDACGVVPLRGFLYEAKKQDLKASLIDLRNSGDRIETPCDHAYFS
jgi:AmmeMemoRadiSam system protein B